MNDLEFLSFAEDLVLADRGTLDIDDSLNDIGWDSLSRLEFIAEANERSNVVVEARRLNECRTLREVHALLSAGLA